MDASQSEIDLPFLCGCLRDAGALALARRAGVRAEVKPDDTPVTAADHAVEDFLIARIAARYPDHRILSEESGALADPAAALAGSLRFTWVIDPIDGTRSFAGGLPIWGVSIGVLRGADPYAGGFFMPVTGDLFWSGPGQAYHNDQPLPRLAAPDLHSVLSFLAVPSDVHLKFQITYPRIRSLGSTAAHLAYAASGAAVGVLTHHVGLWDIAGLLPVLAAVGVTVTTLSGRPFQPAALLDGRPAPEPLLAAHPDLIDPLREAITLRPPQRTA